ncbi:MAG: acetyl-CoA carboxylase carboxyl transferase subunit beta [Candidatus Sumerlaeota bacterium]|nr:acetyl-CoA carboxylase carboxyl transferase subunit beta [Candidatus Sumerlaeota bacterium]
MRWFRRPTPQFITIQPPTQRERIGKDLWNKCDTCGAITRTKDFVANWKVCPKCNRHERLDALERLDLLLDEGSFEETDADLVSGDPLKFVDSKPYPERVEATRKKTGQNDAIVTGRGTIGEVPVAIAAMDFPFMGGSMGCVVGEKVARVMEMAIHEERVCITISSTGGARMQEGILSLMQLAKTSIMCKLLQENRVPFLSILADPSTAGVMASFASLGDLVISEPGAYVGFAGRRVIEQTIRQTLPDNFQTAEFVQQHGFIDLVVHRHEMRGKLITLLRQMRHLPAAEFDEEGEQHRINTPSPKPAEAPAKAKKKAVQSDSRKS